MEKNSCNKLITKQEVFYRLLGIEYFRSSRGFKFASATTKRVQEDGRQFSTELQRAYTKRPASKDFLSLVEFVKSCDYSKATPRNAEGDQFKYTDREKQAIVSTPLQYRHCNEDGYDEYLKNWILHYKSHSRSDNVETSFEGEIEAVNQMTMQARESEYLRIIAEKYNSKDPEDTLLTSKKENALQTEEYSTILV
ncbi:MAG: hypothetical protein MHMPM18_002151 [Marteilia pararefringens]